MAIVEPTVLVTCEAKLAEDGHDPVVLGVAEDHRINRPGRHDRPLQGGVAAPQARIGPQGIAKPRMAATSRLEAGTTCTWTR